MNEFIIVNFLPIKENSTVPSKTDRLFKFSYQFISDGQKPVGPNSPTARFISIVV